MHSGFLKPVGLKPEWPFPNQTGTEGYSLQRTGTFLSFSGLRPGLESKISG
jgi:hypothetical protein